MDIPEFKSRVEAYRDEEAKSSHDYEDLARSAKALGLPSYIVDRIVSISLDEHSHFEFFRGLRDRLEVGEQPPHRLFPRTVVDWQKLGDDIIAKSSQHKAVVNEAMISIEAGDEYSEGSKRLLMSLANSLGIP